MSVRHRQSRYATGRAALSVTTKTDSPMGVSGTTDVTSITRTIKRATRHGG
ncbi:hypothetical protein PV383_29105 [Streptomyces caniscabiei]|uniref:Uncharacterized protein n=1 Tax=Streptomyces caniscabiei TaxID=2746961 RepID=A0ABU4MV01_9ACTN|nr:hypothetical protein [Streptomyces caniscabiei]MBE4740727.1 hypothetical protein [Streptomyces caniscabiei]MDX3041220.1 hypothetical protein [Streptomyces caniscabiei]